MTAEDIIQRLLDERKITVKEALILLKAIAGIVVDDWIGRFKKLVDESNKKIEEKPYNPAPNIAPWTTDPQKPNPWIGHDVVVCYGVQTVDYSTIQNATTKSEEYRIENAYDNTAVFCGDPQEVTTVYGVSSSACTLNQNGSYDASIKVTDCSTKKKHIH